MGLSKSVMGLLLQIVEEETNILLMMKRRKASWIGHNLRGKYLLKHVEGRVEETIKVT
jgi:hypothetical protein